MKRFLFLLLLWARLGHAAVPVFQDFSTNQFDVTGNKIKLRSGALVTNLTFNTFTVPGAGTNSTTYGFPLTNFVSGQLVTVRTNGNLVYFEGTNLPVSTVVFDTIEELVATPIPLPGIGLLAYVRDPLRGGPLAFYPNSVDTTNRFDTYASLDGPGNWKRPPDPNVYVQHGAVTGTAVTNDTLVAALELQSARATGKVVYSGTDEFITNAVPLLDNNVLFFEDGAQATGLRLVGNAKTNITIIGAGFVAAVAGTTIPAVALTNCNNVAIQVASVTGYTAAPYALSGTTGINFLDSLNRSWTPQAFGAMGDPTADDTIAFQAALTLRGMGRRGEIFVPTGSYRITDSLSFPSLVGLRGEGRGRSTILFDPSANDKAVIQLDNGADNIVIQDIGFSRLNTNVRTGISGIERTGSGGSGGRITGCRFQDFNKYTIHIDSPMYFRIQDNDIWRTQRDAANDGDGLAAGDGILFTTFATTCEITLNRFSENDHAITIPLNYAITISGNSFEEDGSTGNFTTDQIHIEAYGAFAFTGNYTEGERTATNQAVLTLYGGSGSTVTGNMFAGDTGGTEYSHIFIHFKGTNYGQNVKGNDLTRPLQFYVDNDSPSQIVDLTENSYRTASGVTRDYAVITPLLSGEYILWPVAQGGVNTVLQNDGSGGLSWAIPGAGTSGNWNASGTTNSTLAGIASANGAIFTNLVGIGGVPSFSLDIQPPTGAATVRIAPTTAGDDATVLLEQSSINDRAWLDFRSGGLRLWGMGLITSTNFSISTDNIQADSKLFIERATGFVGIDTESPATRLDVNGVANAATGYRIANAAASGNYLRGNGTDFVSSAIQAGDLPGTGGLTINATDGVIPYRSGATTFADSPITRDGASRISIPKDGVIAFGSTNIIFMSGGHLVYTNGTSESMFEVRGQGSAVGAIFGLNLGGNTYISSPGTAIYLPENLLITGFIQPGADNTWDVGQNSGGGAWKDGWFKGKLNVQYFNDGTTNYSRGELFMGVSNVVTLQAVSSGNEADNISINFVPLGTGTVQINGVPIGSGSVATDAIWDAKGDLAGGTGANTAARLAVGSNGQVLTADSAEVTGMKWAAASGGGETAGTVHSGGDLTVDNAIVRGDGTGGTNVQKSVVLIGDTGLITGVQGITVSNDVFAATFNTANGSWTASGFTPEADIFMDGFNIDLQAGRITNSASYNGLIFTGTAGSTAAFGAGGTVAYTGNNLSVFAATTSAQLAGVISDETGSGAGGLAMFSLNPSVTGGATVGGGVKFLEPTDNGTSSILVKAPNSNISSDKTITLPDATGTAVLEDNTATLSNKTLTTPTIASFANATHTHADAAGGGTLDGAVIAAGTVANVRLTSAIRTASIGLSIDGGGSAITTGEKGTPFTIPYSGTITGWTLTADQSGSIVVDVWKEADSYDGGGVMDNPPAVADTITASAKPTLATQRGKTSTTLTGWTTAVTAGDTFIYNVDSASTVTRATLTIIITK